MKIPLELGRWFLRKSGTCVELASKEPLLMRDSLGDFYTYNDKGEALTTEDHITQVLPPAKADTKLSFSKPGDIVLFRDYTLGVLEGRDQGAFGHSVRSLLTGYTTSHSTHGWAWGAEAPQCDIILCFEGGLETELVKLHNANAASIRAMVNRLADVVKKQNREERDAEFARTRTGVLHLLDKMESDLNEC